VWRFFVAESSVNVTEGSGKRLHTYDRTISSVLVQEQAVFPAEYPYPSYIVTPAAAVSCAVAGDDIAQVMAGSSLHVRIRRIRVDQYAAITTAALTAFTVYRTTSAGTSGTAITPVKADTADAAAGATAASGVPNASHGTATDALAWRVLLPVQTSATAGMSQGPFWEWVHTPGTKGIIIPAGTSNGIVIRNAGARAGLTVTFEIEFTETAYL
jgi:hypothetical protein